MTIETKDVVEKLRCYFRAGDGAAWGHANLATLNEAADLIQSMSDRIAVLEVENATARAVIGEANNSLYGSLGYFVTTAKDEVAGAVGVSDPPDKYHLAKRIERLKGDSRAGWRALRHLENGLANDALDTLRASLTKEGK